MRKVIFETDAWGDLGWWAKYDPKMIAKIYDLIVNAAKTPFVGLGKPEPLKGNYSGYWSRRITHEHRLIYKVEPDIIVIIALKGHY